MEIKKIVFEKINKLTKQNFDESSDIFNIGIDSLDLVELVTEVEDEYKVMLSDEQLESIKTVGDIIKLFDLLIK